MHTFYDSKPAALLPPFGLSDHNAVAIWPKTRAPSGIPSRKIVTKRDTRPSRKMELGRYLSEIDWHLIESEKSCDEKCKFLSSAIMTGYNILMPEKRVKFHRNDPTWISEDLKRLIALRQRAFSSGNNTMFKFYQNKVKTKGRSSTWKVASCPWISLSQKTFLPCFSINRKLGRVAFSFLSFQSASHPT